MLKIINCAVTSYIAPSSISFEDATVSSTNWTVEQENIFIDLMVEQVQKGNRSTTRFIKESWKKMRTKFYMKIGKKYESKQFQNKFN